MNMALALGLARDAILESSVVELQHRLKIRQRERRLRSRWRAAVRWRLREQGHPIWIHHHRHEHGDHWYDLITRIRDKFFRYTSSDLEDPAWKLQYGPRHKRLNVEALTYEDWHAAALETGAPLSRLVPEELRVSRRRTPTTGYPLSQSLTIEHGQGFPSSMSLTHFRLRGMLALIGNFAMAVTYSTSFPSGSPSDIEISGVQDNATHPHNVALHDEREGISNDNEDQQMEDARLTHGVPLTAIHENDVLMEERLEEDAKYLFYTRLSIAILLFLVFWMVSHSLSTSRLAQ
jgi:potassium channel subfamily K